MTELPKAAIVRIAKNAGADRVGEDAAEIIAQKAEEYIAKLSLEAYDLAKHAKRKTIKLEDVLLALKN